MLHHLVLVGQNVLFRFLWLFTHLVLVDVLRYETTAVPWTNVDLVRMLPVFVATGLRRLVASTQNVLCARFVLICHDLLFLRRLTR